MGDCLSGTFVSNFRGSNWPDRMAIFVSSDIQLCFLNSWFYESCFQALMVSQWGRRDKRSVSFVRFRLNFFGGFFFFSNCIPPLRPTQWAHVYRLSIRARLAMWNGFAIGGGDTHDRILISRHPSGISYDFTIITRRSTSPTNSWDGWVPGLEVCLTSGRCIKFEIDNVLVSVSASRNRTSRLWSEISYFIALLRYPYDTDVFFFLPMIFPL